MSEPTFNPPPGWATPPRGWRPAPGWQPPPEWPPAPEGWVFWVMRPKPMSPLLVTLLGVAGAFAILLVGIIVFVVWSFNQAPPSATERDPNVPVFATVDEAVAYYEEQELAAYTFATEHAFGYDYARIPPLITDARPQVEAAKASGDSATIAAWGYRMAALVSDFDQQIARWERDYAPLPENLVNVSGTPAEEALDSVSAGVSDIAFDDYCGHDDVLACVSSGTLVHVPVELEDYTNDQLTEEYGDYWTSVMVHEFGHVIQNKFIYRLLDDADYQRLFVDVEQPADADDYDYPIEHSADCMALAIMPDYVMGYEGDCTPEQLAFAATIWDGTFYQP